MNRELDIQVAEKIMGIAKPFQAHCGVWITAEREWAEPGDLVYWSDEKGHVRVPCYSADIAAAWQVGGKMRDDGWRAAIWVDADRWCVQFTRGVQVGFGRADTTPEAICKAALKAVKEG